MHHKTHNKFYDSRAWRRVRQEVLKDDNYECQLCKKKGKHAKALIVHHTYHLEAYPEYGLCRMVKVGDTYVRNLISVCGKCHETVCHPERGRVGWQKREKKQPLTVERW